MAGGQPTRGYLDVPRLIDGELRDAALDVGRSGAIIVAGGRVSAEALTRARAMSIRGMVAGSLGQAELRDLAASDARQRAGVHTVPPFGVLGLDGHQRRPIASPILALMAALAGREVAIITDPPLLVFDVMDVPLPDLPPDWAARGAGWALPGCFASAPASTSRPRTSASATTSNPRSLPWQTWSGSSSEGVRGVPSGG